MRMLNLQHALTDGLLFSLVIGVAVMGSLYYNPRLWLHDYPKEIQAKAPPLTSQEKRVRNIALAPILILMLGVPLVSTYSLKTMNGGELSFVSAYLNALIVLNVFNLFDAVVLDLLILAWMQPKFATIPGAEGLEYLYRDWGMHLRNFLKGVVFCGVYSLIVALVITLI